MNEAKLQEIEARANETVRRCVASFGCDAPARWQRTEAFGVARACDACAGDRSGWSPIGSSDLDALDLVAEVRSLVAALKTAREDEREACCAIARSCAEERRGTLARWDNMGVPQDDPRRAWVYCKASEAERIRDTIGFRRPRPTLFDAAENIMSDGGAS